MDEALWDAIAKVERKHWWFAGRREVVARMLERRLPTGASVLDVGCGTGFVVERLARRFDACGLEPDAGVRARATPDIASRILPGSTDDLSALGGRQFDAVTLLDVIEHVDDDAGALHAVVAALRPGGIVLVTAPACPWLWSAHDVMNEHRRRYTRASLRDALARAGLQPMHLSYFNSRLFPLALAHRVGHRRDTTGALRLPPGPVNRAFRALFAGKATGVERGYPFGLSLVTVARSR
jgi:2-polyprenyl-3-methyl-5-hydroxy-6-metoxy-1,4-benzoquinol methylase